MWAVYNMNMTMSHKHWNNFWFYHLRSLARGVRSSYMGPAATVLGHRMSCRIRYRLPSFQVVFFDPRSSVRSWKFAVEINRLGIPLKTESEGNVSFSYECQIPTKNTGPGRIFCLLSLKRGLLPDCQAQVIVGAVMGAGMSLVWMQLGSVRDLKCPELSTVPWCQLCWEGFVSIVGIAKKTVYESIFGDEGAQISDPKEDSDYIIIYGYSTWKGSMAITAPMYVLVYHSPKTEKATELGGVAIAIAIDPDSPV